MTWETDTEKRRRAIPTTISYVYMDSSVSTAVADISKGALPWNDKLWSDVLPVIFELYSNMGCHELVNFALRRLSTSKTFMADRNYPYLNAVLRGGRAPALNPKQMLYTTISHFLVRFHVIRKHVKAPGLSIIQTGENIPWLLNVN